MSRRYGFYDWYTAEPPKRVEGGIKTSSKKGPLVKKWWGKRWIETLERFNIGARLSRGRAYARKGQVTELEITPGRVRAKVQGTQARPYRITLKMQPFSPEQWRTIIEQLVQQPIYAAQLLGNEMPQDIEKVFAKTGLPLFPRHRHDLETECSCPDWSNPCKHIAAVYYLMAEAFDRDPFVLFALRGMERDAFLQELRQSAGETDLTEDEQPEDESEPLPIEADPFWNPNSSESIEFPAPTSTTLHAILPKRLGPLSFWRSDRDFIAEMEIAYQQVQEKARMVLEKLNDGLGEQEKM